ncbi:MAG: ABC transporter ATP-binding protein [Salinivirgaceae bacterium]|jgi:peptide/nickel transport system ATP-binding protein|nr:ABC transporter ATP-binding protein [Salinivirgaceae bacterium]
MNLLEVNNLSISLPGMISLVENISFALKKGVVTGLVGESGSGKSITAHSVLKLLPSPLICSGQIIWKQPESSDIDLQNTVGKDLRRFRGGKVGMVFQDPSASLNPSIRIGKQVLEALFLHRDIRKKAAKRVVLDIFAKVQLPNPERIFKSYPFQLSGGQRQRVMIAMALINNPELLIADEATTALDVTVQYEIIELLKKMQEERQLTVLFITHDLSLLSGFADNLMVMRNGKIIEQGAFEHVFSSPDEAYTKGLVACRPVLSSRGFRLPMVEDFEHNPNYSRQKLEPNVLNEVTGLFCTENVNIWYNAGSSSAFHAVKNVSFCVHKGETLGLVGESGCGKTTLSKALLQLIPYGGQMTLDGNILAYRSRSGELAFRRKIQFVFQDPYTSLNPQICIGNLLIEVLKVHKVENGQKALTSRALKLLEQVGLTPNYFSSYPHQLSGGQRQRVAIARALATEPDVIVLDEAVAALDVSVQAKILNLLNDLKQKFQLTYLFISHDLEVVHYMADRIMVMKDGEIIEVNTATDLFKKPMQEYTRTLIQTVKT